MEITDKEKLKKIGFVSLIFLIIVVILFSLTFFDSIKQSTFKNVALKMLMTSPVCEDYRNVQYIGTNKKYTTLAFPSVLEARSEQNQFYIFFVRLSGKYGVQTGLFLYDETKQKTLFCGIVGQDFKKQSSYYGINQGVINYWCNKISTSTKKN